MFLLGLQFDGEGRGWLGLGTLLRERRAAPQELRVTLVRPHAPHETTTPVTQPLAAPNERITVTARNADPSPTIASVPLELPHASAPTGKDALRLKLSRELAAPAVAVQPVQPVTPIAVVPQTDAAIPARPPIEANPARTDAPAESVAASTPSNTDPTPLAADRSPQATLTVPPATSSIEDAKKQNAAREEAERIEAERMEAARQEAARVEAARLQAIKQEALRQDAAKLEAARQLAAKQDEARQETARVEVARAEAARAETARIEAAKREAARVEAARVEALRVEAARLDAARREAQRVEIQRQETARLAVAQLDAQKLEAARAEAARADTARRDAEKLEAQRQATAQAEALRQQEAKDEDARREARRRNMARILEEEAKQRDNAQFASSKPILPLSLSSARRVRLWGRADPNEELVKYAETFARKVQLNTLPDVVKPLAAKKHTPPLVTVALRSDGTVESVTLVMGSGVGEVDEAIRRIVQSLAPFPPFQPELARDYDVIEIRRTWVFDVAVRLQ